MIVTSSFTHLPACAVTQVVHEQAGAPVHSAAAAAPAVAIVTHPTVIMHFAEASKTVKMGCAREAASPRRSIDRSSGPRQAVRY
jgi:endonuclease/exonuclease/phosphatase (EEP) superfamily protein YafD